jgi:iron(III) transport system substrate-binding protein
MLESPSSPASAPGRRERRRTTMAAAAVAALATASPAACGSAGEPGSEDEPATPGITLYSGRTPPLIGPVIDRYEEKVDRDVQVRFGDSATLAAQLSEEGENSPADVFFSQDAGALGAVEEEGLLAPLPVGVLERVPPLFRSARGNWVGISARARVIAYSDDLPREELPESPLELTEPQWRGRVGWAPTNASLQAYVTALRLTEGEEAAREWLEGMVANDTQVYESNAPVRDAIAAGEIDIGLINHYYVAQAVAAEGRDYPVEVHFPPRDLGSMVNATGVGILASSDEPDDALDFVRFLLTRSSQRYFAESSKEYPLIDGVRPDPELVPLSRVPAPRIDLSRLSDLQGTLELMRAAGAL